MSERFQSSLWRDSIVPGFGIWRDREDLPDFAALRDECDREFWTGEDEDEDQ